MNKIVILLCIVFFITGTFFFINDEKNENNHLYLNTANLPHIADQTSTQAISINVLSPLIAGETVTIQINSPIPVLKNNIAIKKDDHSIRFSFNNNQVQFTPQQTGIHTLQISTKTQALFSLHVDQSLPFSTDHIQVFNQADSLENALGLIINQFWIGSSSLSQDHLHAHIKDQALTVIGSDADLGFLIEIDPENTEDIAAIHALKNTKGIDYVFQRLYEGEQLDRLEAGREPIYPNDYPSWTMGYTENWHLVHIDAPRAWRYTTGNPDVQIGVADGGFDTNHPELQGRVAINLYPANQKSSETQISHGTAVAGAIAASAGNQYGMTGLNFTSPLVLHRAGFRQWVTLAKQPKVKVISASWAIPQHIPNNLNLNDANQVKKRAEAAFKLSRSFRAFAEKNPDKLFIFSAGNGIGNGQGYKGHYAVNGRLHSPALHLSSLNTLSKVPNVMFVSALTAKGPISFSSTYGELVDIAAPAYYKSLSSNNGFKTDNNGKYGINGGFKGTSSAAPVVAGVASLIYSINPNLQGHEVKALLLESAKEKATQRFINYQSKKTEHLAHPIPILHADKALSATYQYLKKNTKFTLAVADPVKRTIHV
ncbi:MAG: S8 family serine peptidase, partial [Cellvibrionales bacterium]|nr:S8 family serine peptidase [Cellvibrionales bacterium]